MKCFSNTCWLLLLLTVKIAVIENGNILVNEGDSESHNKAVRDSEVHKDDEVSEVRLVVWNDDELDEVSEVYYDEVMRSERQPCTAERPCNAGRERLTPFQSDDPSPQYQPIE